MKRSLCLALALLAAGCGSQKPAEPLWIGHMVPLSGPARDRGEEAVRAIAVAMQRAREDGLTVAGRPVGVRHVDSASANARAEQTRLLAVNRVVALILGPGTRDVQDLLATARAHGVPLIVLDEVAEPPDFTGVTLLGPDPGQRGEELARAARERLKLKKVAVVVDPACPVCQRLAAAFSRSWLEGKGELRRWELPRLSDEAAVREVLDWKPGAVLAAVPSAKLVGAVEAPLRTLLDGQTVLYGGEDTEALVDGRLLRGLRVKGLTGVTTFPGVAALLEAARKRFAMLESADGPPPGLAAALALDGIGLTLEGLKNARGGQRDSLRDALEQINEYDGVTGTVTWKEGRPLRPLFVHTAGGQP